MATRCKICYDKLDIYKHNRTVYCSEACKKAGKDASNRVLAQNKTFQRMMKGRTCQKCQTVVYEIGMRKYCKKCREDMELKMKKCIDCGVEHDRASERCAVCAKKRMRKQQLDYQKQKRAMMKKTRYCKLEKCGKPLPEDMPYQTRYCCTECFKKAEAIRLSEYRKKPEKVKKEPKKKFEINPMFLSRNYSGKELSMSTGVSCMNA